MDIYRVLHHWQTATYDEVQYVKSILMPQDNIEHITFKVTSHPTWFDIDIFQDGRAIGYLTVDTDINDIIYYFDE
jgi:hypothetical protein